jgi:hypothetical protein
MTMPGFIDTDIATGGGQQYTRPTRATRELRGIIPAGCYWYDWLYAPVACGFVAANEAAGIPGYGRSPCAVWQIPFDIFGCAALPRDRNRY